MTPQKADGELELNFKHLSRWSQPVLEVRAKELSWGSRRPWAPGLHRQPFAMQVWLSLWALNHFDLCEALNHFDLCEDKEEVGREVASCLTLLKKQVKRRITTGLTPVVHKPEWTLESLRHALKVQSPGPLILKYFECTDLNNNIQLKMGIHQITVSSKD